MSKANPNPRGREGKPFSLKPYSFDDALRKILSAKPEPKPAKKTSQRKATDTKQPRKS